MEDVETTFSRALDAALDEQAIKELLIQEGRYITVPPVEVREIPQEDKHRLLFAAHANIVSEDGSLNEKITFWFSHQRFNRDDGSPDAAYKNYLSLRQAFKDTHNEVPKTIDEIVTMMSTFPLSLRVTQYNGRNYVVGIKAIKA